ncbi:hypothetical protein KKG65_00610 [Patescibacteria group bacterium]|nr:hypothetical protein [Patescibacteria group bacterium]
MPQVSKYTPHPFVQKKIKQLLVDCICHSNDTDTTSQFLNDFLTSTEKIVLGKRLALALMLLKNSSIEDIIDALKVSKSTIYKTKEWLEIAGDGYRNALQKIIDQDNKMEKQHKRALEEYDSSPLWHMTNWKNLKARQRKKIKDTEIPF